VIKRAIAISFIFLASCTSVSQAEVKQADKPILLHADDMVFDQKNNTIKATGNVQAYQEKEALTTDSLFYDRGLGKITADGHVAWQMSNGDVYFGSHAVMQNQMKDASINNFRGLLIDESRLAANHGVRRNGTETQMDQAVYSPCRVCRETPDKAPLWQIKAESVLIDEEAQDIIYTDAWMEIIGVPVLYTPYFRHPTPSVKQRSGILTPRLNVSKELGFYYVQPYYHVISPDKDITIEPLITKKKGAILSAEYRQRFSNANLRLGGSGGPSKRKVEKEKNKVKNKKYEDAWRGHIDSSLEWDVNENWRISANALGANDKTYLRLFPFYGHVHDNVLTSQAKAEGFYGLNYVRVQGYAYQGLRKEDKQKTIPLVAPIIDLNYVSPEQFWGSRFYVDANSLVLTRRKGTDVQRLSTTVSWKLPFVTALGDKYALSFRLRGDGYNRQEFKPHQHESRKKHSMHEMNGAQGRVFPQSVLEWEYPWINASSSGHVIISPMASLIVAPKLSNQRNIPNEDCEFIEPNDEYILTHSRFPGLDRIDDCSRIN
jgi:LPS-assembly protein